jgi:hypothetical protein
MSEESSPKGLEPHPLVKKLLSSGAQPGENVTIVGYIGRSPGKGRVRVYLNLALSSYCDVAASDILTVAPVDSTSEMSASIIWVKLGAQIDRVDTNRSRTVLGGQIQQNYLHQAMPEPRYLTDKELADRVYPSQTCQPVHAHVYPSQTC